ncbi:hypothetical protein, partial [Cellulosimicrobium funkei]
MTSSSDATGGPVGGRPDPGRVPEPVAHDAEVVETVVDDVAAPEDGRGPARGRPPRGGEGVGRAGGGGRRGGGEEAA